MKKFIVNIFGGPGSGKSTATAYIYAGLKMAGVNCEMCLEQAKFFIYEKNRMAISDQKYLFARQAYVQSMLNSACDVVITDAPLLSFMLYNNLVNGKEDYKNLIHQTFIKYHNINYYLTRHTEYSTFGRYQTEEEADVVAKRTHEILEFYQIEHTKTSSRKEDLDKIILEILEILKKN